MADDSARREFGPRFAGFALLILAVSGLLAPSARAQVDPVDRSLLHVGYNQPLEGKTPLAVYAFYLHNRTNFLRPNLTLRAAVAPVWVDSQLGIRGALGENTDVGLVLAGGGFARTYNELRLGEWEQGESFTGHGYTAGAAVYHLFNPGQRLPVYGIGALTAEGSFYSRDDDTDPAFTMPRDNTSPVARAGLRIGGQEPDFRSPFALEVSAWYEGRYRIQNGAYGFGGDRTLEEFSQLFWGRVLARLTSPDLRHDVEFAFTAGGSAEADRLSAYRLGGMLPFSSEFPLMIPGYYFQELTARNFVLLSGNYSVALAERSPFRFAVFGAISSIDYLEGLEYPGRSHAGIGGGITWRAPRRDWIVTGFYGYGFDAVRDHGNGGQMVGLLVQYDFLLDGGWEDFLAVPRVSHGLLRLFGR